jgi:glycerophosphoryl diester phosphodiesterase
LIAIKKKWPGTVTVALLDDTTTVPDQNGIYPWLGGVKLVNGDWVAVAASIGAGILSPVHCLPSNVSVNTPGYTPFITKQKVSQAHHLGMKVVPWTVDYEVTISKLIDDGVDSVISNYPERVMWIAKQRGLSSGNAKSASKPECLVHTSG